MIESDVQSLAPGAIVEGFELDATGIGGEILRWTSGPPFQWQGNSFTPFPVEASGFEKSSKGTLPRPTLRAANVSGLLGAFVRRVDGLLGAKVTRKRTFVKYLDGQPQADPNCGFADEIYFVDRKVSENGIYIEFELSSAFDAQGVQLPRRQCIQNACQWAYRGPDCGYTGPAVANRNDVPTTDMAQDQCGKRLTSCKMRFGQFEPLSFGGMPGVGLIR